MEKRKQNKNKGKKNCENVLQNSCDKTGSALDQDEKKKKNSQRSCSSGDQKESSCVQPSSHKAVSSCKEITHTHGCNPGENNRGNGTEEYKSKNLNAANIPCTSHDTEANKLSEEICNTSVNKSENGIQYSSSTAMRQVKPVTFHPFDIPESNLTDEFPISYTQKNNSLSKNDDDDDDDDDDNTSYFPVKKSIVTGKIKTNSGFHSYPKDFDHDRQSFSRCVKGKTSEIEEEYSTSDFFKPVFDDWHKDENKATLENILYGADDKSSHWPENAFSNKGSYSGHRNPTKKPLFDGKELKDTICSSVHAYNSSKDFFSDVYHTWLPKRRNTLQKLKTLRAEVRNDQLKFNESQKTFREASYESRMAKDSGCQVVDFFASLSAFLNDTASGIVSVSHAVKIDSYQTKFKEIIEHDAEITQQLYKARSQCFEKYYGIEEGMRKFHSDNFSCTLDKMSNTLELGKYWESMKKAYEKDDMHQLLDVLGKFLDNACQSTKLEEVSDLAERYVDHNPAALDAFKSAGRATYGAVDVWKLNRSQNNVLRGMNTAANRLLMIDDRREIQRLRNTIEEDSPQSKVESQIEDAIYSLESELREINDIYFELFKK